MSKFVDRLAVHDYPTLRGIFGAAARETVPIEVRAFWLENTTTASVGRATAGLATPPRATLDEWGIVLAERDGAESTFLHELAHAYLQHRRGTPTAEREAAGLAREWGANGPAADADGCAERLEAVLARPPVYRARIGRQLSIECGRCFSTCEVIAPTVEGLTAIILAECPICRIPEVVELAATWAAGSTPRAPILQREGVMLPLATHSEPEMTPDQMYLKQATSLLLRIEETLRRTHDAAARDFALSSLAWTRTLLGRAIASLPQSDARRVFIEDAVAQLAAAPLLADDATRTADAVASAARTLGALLTPKGDKPAGADHAGSAREEGANN